VSLCVCMCVCVCVCVCACACVCVCGLAATTVYQITHGLTLFISVQHLFRTNTNTLPIAEAGVIWFLHAG